MSCFSLPGIKKLHILSVNDLPENVMLHSQRGLIVALAAPSEQIELIGTPTLKWEGSKVNGCRQESATLEFSTIHPLPELPDLAFVVSCVNGKQYLIGSREGRRPIVNYTGSTGDPRGSASVYSYKITHIAQKSVLPCVL